MRRRLENCRGLLTGASSGIGLALARRLLKRGARLVLVARRGEALKQLAAEAPALGGQAVVVAGDITEPAVRQAALDAARHHWGGLDLVINNAGIGAIGPLAEGNAERLRRIMEVNFFAAAELIRGAIGELQRGRDPLIVNVSSVLGQTGVPDYADYCASKFALEGLSAALRRELAPAGISVLVVRPGTTQSEFFDRLLTRQGPLGKSGRHGVSADYVALAIVRAIERGRREIVPSTSGWWLLWADRWMPQGLDWVIGRRMRRHARVNQSDHSPS